MVTKEFADEHQSGVKRELLNDYFPVFLILDTSRARARRSSEVSD
jgi:hypothetical protein